MGSLDDRLLDRDVRKRGYDNIYLGLPVKRHGTVSNRRRCCLSCAPVRDVPAGRSRSSFAQVHHMHGSRSRYDPQKQRDLLYCLASNLATGLTCVAVRGLFDRDRVPALSAPPFGSSPLAGFVDPSFFGGNRRLMVGQIAPWVPIYFRLAFAAARIFETLISGPIKNAHPARPSLSFVDL